MPKPGGLFDQPYSYVKRLEQIDKAQAKYADWNRKREESRRGLKHS